MRIVSLFTRHATAANLLMSLILAFGVYATTQLRAQFMPDVISEEVSVSIAWEDASAEDVADDIVNVVSPNLLGVEGVSSLSAIARSGQARFTLEFEPGWDISRAMEDVDAAMPSASALPEAAEDAEIARGVWRERVFDVVLSGDVEADRIEALGEELKQEFLRAGITRVSLRGVTSPEITLEIDAAHLAEYGMSLSDVGAVIEANARESAVGEAGASGTPVRIGQDKLSAEGLAGMELRTDRGVISLDEIAQVQTSKAGSGRAYFLEGRPAVSISVERGPTGDALAIQREVIEIGEAFVAKAPEELQIDLMRNMAEGIGDQLSILIDNAFFGLGLVLVLLFVFLSPSAAVWVSAGIPVAMAAGLGLMWVTGQSLNMISMFALLICLGIIVDDAIVVAEHAEYRHRTKGERRDRAAERAARGMLVPVLASTVTTVVAFMSLQSIDGRFGEFIATIPLVVAAVLAASLAECFLILPHHLGHGLAKLDTSFLSWPSRVVNRAFDRMRVAVFAPVVRALIAARYAVLLLAVGATLQGIMMVVDRDVSWRFFVAPQSTTISANIAMTDEATRGDTMEMLDEMLRAANEVRADFEAEHGADPVTAVLTEIGGSAGRGLATAEDKDADLLGALTIELIGADDRPYDADAFVQAFEQALRKPETLETFSFRAGRFGPGGDSLDVALYGYDPMALDQAAEALKEQLALIPDITGLEDDLTLAATGQSLRLTGLGRAMGFDETDVATELRNRLNGVEAVSFQEGSQEAVIRVELPEDALSAAYLEEILIQSSEGQWAELGEIVEVVADPSITSIRSEAGQSVVHVTGEISATDPLRAEAVMTQIREVELPAIAASHGVSFEMGGLAEQESEFLGDALVGYGICLLLIYMTLALVLGNWFWPLSIMGVIPVGLTGVIWGHYWWDLPMSIFSIVGFVGMSGIIVNDSIVLVTAISDRMKTMPHREAIVDAVSERLRPVLLTTLTTVLGLAPLLFEASTQAAFLKPMVVTLCFGLIFGFFIVLFVVPSLIAVQGDIGSAIGRLRGAGRGLAPAGADAQSEAS
ncbi:efflux RND transporter permease subunit [Limimaricola litoreus]|uniref:Efflux RND transporter permease subunit n=1 Tax=Limimaricola litoreus TaxID=2955316 RepID=A0A9X2JS49_9RHOB|nr:efflux RND transporter permease subunit [Limimaricola litoreus]MCP1169366.1 efflux RND transporter permease subunit [Limimaricola litoreus]